jgi:predicted nucleotidyltransferase
VFGSVARGDARSDSDIDLLVELEPGRTLLDLAGFRRDAQTILGLDVDVVTPETVRHEFRDNVLTEAVPL